MDEDGTSADKIDSFTLFYSVRCLIPRHARPEIPQIDWRQCYLRVSRRYYRLVFGEMCSFFATARDEKGSLRLHLLGMLPCSFALRIRILEKTRCLFNDTPAISRLHVVENRAKLGRCHYHSNGTPSVKNIDDESLVKVKVGIGKPVELR